MQIRAFLPADRERFSDPPRDNERAAPADVRNFSAALFLNEYRAFSLAGRDYRVPPIPGRAGVELMQLAQRWSGRKTADAAQLGTLLRDIRAIAERLLRPLGWRRWLGKRGIRRDTRRWTAGETVAVLNFFCTCQMNGVDRFSPIDLASPSRETSSMN